MFKEMSLTNFMYRPHSSYRYRTNVQNRRRFLDFLTHSLDKSHRKPIDLPNLPLSNQHLLIPWINSSISFQSNLVYF